MPRKKVFSAKAPPPPPPLVSTENTENEGGFTIEEEIAWCTKKLQHLLAVKVKDSKDVKAAKPIVIALKTLENKNNPLPKMRKMMRAGCGDYRKEMIAEFKQAQAESKNVSVDHQKNVKCTLLKSKKTGETEDKTVKNDNSDTSTFCFDFPSPEIPETV